MLLMCTYVHAHNARCTHMYIHKRCFDTRQSLNGSAQREHMRFSHPRVRIEASHYFCLLRWLSTEQTAKMTTSPPPSLHFYLTSCPMSRHCRRFRRLRTKPPWGHRSLRMQGQHPPQTTGNGATGALLASGVVGADMAICGFRHSTFHIWLAYTYLENTTEAVYVNMQVFTV